jgi:glycosyltransferase involved in cell wall biosynthesis
VIPAGHSPLPLTPRALAAGDRLRIALAHDWLCGLRGGERVLDALARLLLPQAEITAIYTMFDDRRPLTPALDRLPRVVSSVGRPPWGSTRLRRWLLPRYPAAVEELSALLAGAHAHRRIDLLISTSSAAIKGMAAPPGIPHLCYIHSPARYLWSRREDYAGGLRGLGLSVFGGRLRRWDAAVVPRVTHFVANSGYTAREVARCYGRDAQVVHPPVRTAFFSPPPANARRQDVWLLVGALEPYKRADLAVAAANARRHRLVVIGDGSERRRLERMAGPTVTFLGRVDDARLLEAYRAADVLLFPQVEDFGIAAAEALCCGLPVVARRDGGATDMVEEGVSGALFADATPGALLDAIRRCPRDRGADCRRAGERFAEDRFDRGMLEQITGVLARA